MPLKVCELISIILSALVAGVFWGPWVSLSRSMATFEPRVFLAITHRMAKNLEPVMSVLMPAALLSIIAVLNLSYRQQRQTFNLTLVGLAMFLIALLVTILIEVPIVNEIRIWSVATIPANWELFRDRWVRFHLVRVVTGIAGLVFLVAGAIL